MTNLDSVFKSRDITFPTKVLVGKAMIFPIVMYKCERWTIKRLNAKELMTLNCIAGEVFESPLENKEIKSVNTKGNQSWIFIGRADAEAETPILWSFMQRTDSFEKTLMLGKIEGGRRREWQRMRWLDGITDSMDMRLSRLWEFDGQGSLAFCGPWGHKELDMTEPLNWTELL